MTRLVFVLPLVLASGTGLLADGPQEHVPVVPWERWENPDLQPDRSVLEKAPMGEVRFVTIHHTASPFPDTVRETIRIRNMQYGHQVADRQWGDIAYHFLIGPSGMIYAGRSPEFAPASGTVYLTPEQWEAAGQDDSGQTRAPVPEGASAPGASAGHIAVTFVGDFGEKLPPPEALDSAVKLVASLLQRHQLGMDAVLFHREVAAGGTTCPGDRLYDWFRGTERVRGAEGEGLTRVRTLLKHP